MENIIEQANQAVATNQQPLRKTVELAVKSYFNHFNQSENQSITNLYDLVLAEIEEPVLRSVMEETRGNQSKAAILLGLSRGTLRKKLKTYDLL